MDEAMAKRCAEWCARQFWQYQKRERWSYVWHGETLVRYVETAPADPEFAAGLLEYLSGDASAAGATAYNRPAGLGEGWRAVCAWYEQGEGAVDERTRLKLIRVFQALQRSPDGGGDGPYAVEDGCAWKVSHTFLWKLAEPPQVPKGESGVQHSLKALTRDDETGLWNCVIERRERVRQDVPEYVRAVTQFESVAEERHLGVRKGDVDGCGREASAGGGRLVRRKVEKNDDCTSDVTNETVTERQVLEARRTVRRTARARIETVEDRNAEKPIGDGGLKVGEEVRNELTDGGRWNRVRVKRTAVTGDGPIRRSCAKTAFAHEHAETTVGDSMPAKLDAKAAGGGVSRKVTLRLNDEDGTVEREDAETAEIPVAAASVTVCKGIRGTRRSTVSRSQEAPGSEAGLKPGDTLRSELTDGGRWNVTVETSEPEAGARIAERCRKTALSHEHSEARVAAGDPGKADAREVSGGVVSTREVRRNDEGGWDVTETADAAIPARAEAKGGTATRRVTRTELRNQDAITAPDPQANVEVDAVARMNEHGLVDGSLTVTEHLPARAEATSEAGDRTVEESVEANATEVPEPEGGVNVEDEISATPNDHGSKTVRRRRTTYRRIESTAKSETALYDEVETSAANDDTDESEPRAKGTVVTRSRTPNGHSSCTSRKTVRTAKAAEVEKTWTTSDGSYSYENHIKVYRNQESVPNVPDGKYRCSVSLSINEYGLYDVVVQWSERTAVADGEGQSQSGTGTEKKWISYQKQDGKLYRRLVTANFTVRRESGGRLHTFMLDGAESGYGFRSHDNGSFGVKYTKITVGEEEPVGGEAK